MKKSLLVFAVTLAVSPLSFSQGFYAELNAGYGFSIGSDVIGANYTSSDVITMSDWTSSGTYEIIRGSHGQGMNFGLDLGYMFNPNIGLSLNTNYLMGKTFTATDTDKETYTDPSGTTTFEANEELTIKAQMLRLMPSLVLALDKDKVKPYAKIGLALGVMNKMDVNSDYSDTNGDSESMVAEVYGGIAIGLNSELGLEYKLSDKLSLIGSVNSINMSYAPTRGMITSYKVNGTEQIDSFTTRDKEVEFVDTDSYNSNEVPNENEPSQDSKEYHPFSSVGLRVGLRFNL